MHALHKILKNPLTQVIDDQDRERLTTTFPALQACPTPHFLALRCYLNSRPEKFFDKTAYTVYLDWLQARDGRDREALKEYFLYLVPRLTAPYCSCARLIQKNGMTDNSRTEMNLT